ncbi:hypothetical protein PHACT_04275 [Pseudohongiella acticola]|uniref:histidine kinase n=2 Tax=Pseudohongiella acticola TaxID=1524254 RepID=A0A1E8CJK7_9GAMM|nr:hypothetical protein PHACT_04275 [Pseudohongiella acticola]
MTRMSFTVSRDNWRFMLMVLVLFAALMIPLELGLRTYRDAANSELAQDILEQSNRLRALLESEINTAAFLATGVESYIVAKNGDIDPEEIQRILALVFERGRHFRNIGLAPDNQIEWVFPLTGNESAVGLRYADLPEQWPAVERAMTTGEGQFNGPVDLVQGGRGLLYRAPIMIDGAYWGLLSTVIDADSLLGLMDSVSGELSGLLALRHAAAGRPVGPVFYGPPSHFENPLNVLSIGVPGGEWQMAVQARDESLVYGGRYYLLGVLFVMLLSVLLGLALRLVWQRNLVNRLDVEIKARTADLRQSHDLLDSVLSAARSFAIIATDTKGIITLFNKGAEQMLGYSAHDMVGKRHPTAFLLADELNEREARLEEELERPLVGDEALTLKARQGLEEIINLHYRHRDGHLVPVQAVVSAITSQDGSVQGYLGIAEDVSERRRNETLKNQFISTVSHELRTPLTSIAGALGLIKSGTLGELSQPAQEMVSLAHNNSQRLASLINDLLDIEKIAAGKLSFDSQWVSVADQLKLAQASIDNYSRDQQVIIRESEGCSLVQIKVDQQRFQQVIANLLSNAIKFSPSNGQVWLYAELVKDQVRISVEDQGEGISEEFRESIFQRFAQADSSDQRNKGGTGLGLAISKELVEKMGGTIDFSANEPRGSIFWVEFPCRMPTSNLSKPDTDTLSDPRLLVIEDDVDAAHMLKILLEEVGYHVTVASTAYRALQLCSEQSFAAITLDLGLPDMDGIDLLAGIRKIDGLLSVPIIVVSGRVQQGELELLEHQPELEIIPKPINSDRLLQVLRLHTNPATTQGRILHVEDSHDLHRVVREVAGSEFRFHLATSLKTSRELLQTQAFDLVLLDLGMPDGNGADLITDIRQLQPLCAIMLLTGQNVDSELRARVDAALMKSALSLPALLSRIELLIRKVDNEH